VQPQAAPHIICALYSPRRALINVDIGIALPAADVADYIVTFYNRSRHHGHLGGVSPDQFETAHKARR